MRANLCGRMQNTPALSGRFTCCLMLGRPVIDILLTRTEVISSQVELCLAARTGRRGRQQSPQHRPGVPVALLGCASEATASQPVRMWRQEDRSEQAEELRSRLLLCSISRSNPCLAPAQIEQTVSDHRCPFDAACFRAGRFQYRTEENFRSLVICKLYLKTASKLIGTCRVGISPSEKDKSAASRTFSQPNSFIKPSCRQNH